MSKKQKYIIGICNCLKIYLILYFRFLTPVHVAADKSHFDVLDCLLKHGAKVNYYIQIILNFYHTSKIMQRVNITI